MRPDDQDQSQNIKASQLTFLGTEFLTWAYFHLLSEGGQVQVGRAKLTIGKKMTLKPLSDNGHGVAISSPMLDDCGEALQAIRAGALVDTIALEMVIGERHCSFILYGSDGAISQVQLTQSFANDLESPNAAETNLLTRFSALEEIESVVDELFLKFLERRLDRSFGTKDILSMQMSVAEGLAAKLPHMGKSTTQTLPAQVINSD